MRPQYTHVRAAVIAAVLTVLAACYSGDGPVNPTASAFDTVQSETTSAVGAVRVANVVAGAAGSDAANQPPNAWISKPSNNSSWAQSASISFSGYSSDPEDGRLSGAALVWTSSIDGQIGTGRSFSHSNLSGGTHTITFTGTDTDGASFSHNRIITVAGAANTAPVASITSPANNASAVQGTSVSFAGAASDAQSGALSGSALVWSSNSAGQIGTGASFSLSTIPVGTHTITLRATDPQGATHTAVRTLSITAAPPVNPTNQDPFGLIATPAYGASIAQGTSIAFTGSASDPEDGILSGASLVWRSSIDGQIGTGTSFAKSNLSVGSHTITFTSTDAQGGTFSHNRAISITAAATPVTNTAPSATISAPANGVSVAQAANVTFSGSASDQESGALTGSALVWTSSRDGQIGTGASFSKNNLTVGTHTITLTARDPQNAAGTATRTITVSATAPANTAPVANFNASCVLLVCSFDGGSSTDNAGITQYAWNFGSGVQTRTTATISNTFLVAGTVNVTLTVTDAAGLTGTITKSVSMSAGTTTPPSGGGAEPAGMSKLSETSFDCVSGCGQWAYWDQSYANASTLVPDATALKGGSGVIQQNYTPALQGGTSPGVYGTALTQKQTLYVAMWMKLSSNYQGHGSGVNKVLHFWTKGGRNTVIFNIRGSGSGTLVPGYLTQGMAASYQGQGTEVNFDAAPSTCTVPRGSWVKYEMVLKNNTPGAADGTAELWMNGTKCVNVSGLTIVAAGQNNKWEDLWWGPTWGGVGGAVTSTFYEAVDHIYVSGK